MSKVVDDRLPWFKCYPTLLIGALTGMKPDVGYVYTFVLLRTYEVGGPCPDTSMVLSRRTGLTIKRVEAAIDWLVEEGKLSRSDAGLVNPFSVKVLNERNQTTKALVSAGKTGGEKSAAKRQVKSINDPKPGLKSNEASGKPRSTDLDKDSDSELDLGSKEEPPRKRVGSSLPKEWTPDQTDYEYAAKLGLTISEAESCAEDLRLWARANANRAVGRKADWISTYHGWMRREAPKIIRQRGFNKGGSHGKTTNALGGFSGLGSRLRQAVAEDRLDLGEPASGYEQANRR
jgi:hypothetical protein